MGVPVAKDEKERLIFTTSPTITIATVSFVRVPVIVQYGETPLLELVKNFDASFSTRISVYHKDGTKLAVVRGTQIYATEEGKKVGIELKYPPLRTICELEGKPIFEIERAQSAALKMKAELHTSDGSFLRWTESDMLRAEPNSQDLQVLGITMRHCRIEGYRIGIRIGRDGSVVIGCS